MIDKCSMMLYVCLSCFEKKFPSTFVPIFYRSGVPYYIFVPEPLGEILMCLSRMISCVCVCIYNRRPTDHPISGSHPEKEMHLNEQKVPDIVAEVDWMYPDG